jgi:hypothetical protein
MLERRFRPLSDWAIRPVGRLPDWTVGPASEKSQIAGQAAVATDTASLHRRVVRIATVAFHCASPFERSTLWLTVRETANACSPAKSSRCNPAPPAASGDGLLWDVVTVYQPDAVWTETLPFASVFDGPVVNA